MAEDCSLPLATFVTRVFFRVEPLKTYTPHVRKRLLLAAVSAWRITIWIVCPPVIVWPASSGCEMNWQRMMSACVEIAEVEFRVVMVEESFAVPQAKRANWEVSVQPALGAGVIGLNAVDSR